MTTLQESAKKKAIELINKIGAAQHKDPDAKKILISTPEIAIITCNEVIDGVNEFQESTKEFYQEVINHIKEM